LQANFNIKLVVFGGCISKYYIFGKLRRESFAAFGVVKESPRSDSLVACKLLKGNDENNNESAYHIALCLSTPVQNTDNVEL
jgi:hypothetical protein